MKPEQTVVWIVGQAYCGSSILNLLLDHQPGVRGIGEAFYLWRDRSPDIFCSGCRDSVGVHCPQYAGLSAETFYAGCFARTGARVLVDASKCGEWFLAKPAEPFPVRVIVLSKAPREAAWSMLEHCRHDWWGTDKRHVSIDAAWESWEYDYRTALDLARGRFLPDDVRTLTYRAMVERPDHSIRGICEWLGLPFAALPEGAALWRTDTHVIAGNAAVSSEVAGDAALGVPRGEYLGGKYARRRQGVEPDDSWRESAAFLAACEEAWPRWAARLGPLIDALGH